MSLKPLKETVELWHRINNASSLEESLKSGNMSSFLMLEDSVEAINALNTQIDQTMADLKTLGNKMPPEMTNTAAALKDAVNQVAKLRLKASPKIKIFQLGDPVKKASKVMADASTLAATAVAAGQTIMGSLGDYEIDTKSTETLKAALDAKRAENDQVPDENAMIGAVQKAWQTPSGFGNAVKGFLGALGIGKGSNFFGLDAKGFAADILASPVAATVAWLQSPGAEDSLTSDEKELAGLDDKLNQAGLDDEALKGGEGKEGKEGEKQEGGGDTKKWSELSAAYLKNVEDQAAGKKYLDALKADSGFAKAVADLINLEESMYRTSLSSLLFEKIEFDVLKAAATKASDDEAAQGALAKGMAKVLSDQGIDVNNVPADDPAADNAEAAPSEEDVAAADKAAIAAAQAAAKTDLPPAEAAGKAIDDWVGGLSQNMQKALNYKGRLDNLKGVVNSEVEGMSQAVNDKIKTAVDKWTEENKEGFPKEFFKNKDKEGGVLNTTFTKTLPGAIGGVVSAMMKKTAESGNTKWTVGMINRFTYSYMDKWYATNFENRLNESLINPNRGYHSGETYYDEDDMVRYRWLKMAGLGK